MLFKVTSTSNANSRCGILSELINETIVNVMTPGCLLYTRYGSVPYLLPDVYENIELLPNIAFASMNYVTERKYVLHKFKQGLAKFAGLGNRGVLLFQSDPANPGTLPAVDKSSVPVWATGGRIQLSISDYVRFASFALPIGFQAPVDNETFITNRNPTAKRCRNSVHRTAGYLALLTEERSIDKKLKNIPVLVSIAGGHDLCIRIQSINRTDFSISQGIVIDGVTQDLPASPSGIKNWDFESDRLVEKFLKDTLPKVCSHLPSELPRFMAQIWNPPEIVLAARAGCDIFDGSLPFRLTRSGVGWIYQDWTKKTYSESESPMPKFLVFPLDRNCGLSDEEQLLPIQPGCTCFACTHHTRIYISHLHIAQEMLAHMLLMIHNSHQCYRFFSDLRESIIKDEIDAFYDFASNWRFPADLLSVDKTNECKNIPLQDSDDL